MAEIKTAVRSLPKEEIHLHLEGDDLDMETARAAAKHKVREINPDAADMSGVSWALPGSLRGRFVIEVTTILTQGGKIKPKNFLPQYKTIG